MTYIHTPRLYFGLLFLILSFQRCRSTTALSVRCMIINLDYVECIWNPSTSAVNYTFSSEFANEALHDCPEYILEHNYTVGCRIPLNCRNEEFSEFNTSVFTERIHTFKKSFDSLQRHVRLNAPYNLSVKWNEHNSSLLLQWSSSTSCKPGCVVYNVRNQKDASKSSTNVTATSYTLPQVSRNEHYVFQVRSTVVHNCGSSDYWSDWSPAVEWGSEENVSRQRWWQWLYFILSALLLFFLGLLLWYCERRRIIFLKVVPDPSKNLKDLFHKHDGNVESWVHISKELKEAFEPDYTEPSCDVCEVTPSCEADPAPVASAPPPTDKCDEPSTAEEQSS